MYTIHYEMYTILWTRFSGEREKKKMQTAVSHDEMYTIHYGMYTIDYEIYVMLLTRFSGEKKNSDSS